MDLSLIENRTSSVSLSEWQVRALVDHVPKLIVTPTRGQAGTYDFTPGQSVGQVQLGDLRVHIQPKIEMHSVMFMLAYALDSRHWRDLYTEFPGTAAPLDAIAGAFGRELARTLPQGLLRGYMT